MKYPRAMVGVAAVGFVGFLLCVPAANWLIANVGTVCLPGGACLIPVAPGLMAPSGVLVIGVALVLRDVVHSRLGPAATIGAIVAGGGMSAVFAPLPLLTASVVAFLLSELADMAVYAPLRERRLALAVMVSGIVGAVVDSAVFLWLAFGSLAYLPGQVVGKAWASILAFIVIRHVVRRKSEAIA